MTTQQRRIALLTGASLSAIAASAADPMPRFGRSFLPFKERLVSTLEDPNRLFVWLDDAGDIKSVVSSPVAQDHILAWADQQWPGLVTP